MEENLNRIIEQLMIENQPGFLSWVAAIGPILTFFVLSFYIYQYINSNKRKKYEKSIDFVNFYSEEILPFVGYILDVYRKANIEDILHKIAHSKLYNFNFEEYSNILTENEQQRAVSAIDNLEVCTFMELHEKYFLTPYPESLSKTNFDKDSHLDCTLDMKRMLKRIYINEFKSLCVKTLNSLEAISIGFILNVADERIVYCSMYYSFLETVKILYFKIASLNNKAENKYYTYLIKLYRVWDTRYNSSKTKKAKVFDQIGFPGKPLSD